MEHMTVLLIIGSAFILIGLAGTIKYKDGEARLFKPYTRIIAFFIGGVLMFFGLFGMDVFKYTGEENPPSSSNGMSVISGYMFVGRYLSDTDEWYFVVNDGSGTPLTHINQLKSNSEYFLRGLPNASYINLRSDNPDYNNYTNERISNIPILRPIYKGSKIKILELLSPYDTYDQNRKEYWAHIEYYY